MMKAIFYFGFTGLKKDSQRGWNGPVQVQCAHTAIPKGLWPFLFSKASVSFGKVENNIKLSLRLVVLLTAVWIHTLLKITPLEVVPTGLPSLSLLPPPDAARR